MMVGRQPLLPWGGRCVGAGQGAREISSTLVTSCHLLHLSSYLSSFIEDSLSGTPSPHRNYRGLPQLII